MTTDPRKVKQGLDRGLTAPPSVCYTIPMQYQNTDAWSDEDWIRAARIKSNTEKTLIEGLTIRTECAIIY